MNGANQCFTLEHGACPTCGRCRCCGQYTFTFPDLNISTTVVDCGADGAIEFNQLDAVDKFMELIKGVRCNSSYPIDRKIVEDIINE